MVAKGRRSGGVRRGGRASFISTGTEAGAALMDAIRGEVPADRVIARVDLRRLTDDLAAYAARGELESQNLEVFVRACSGEPHREIAESNAGGLDWTGVRYAIKTVRRFLEPRLKELEEGEER